jgi:hypothetical protein
LKISVSWLQDLELEALEIAGLLFFTNYILLELMSVPFAMLCALLFGL